MNLQCIFDKSHDDLYTSSITSAAITEPGVKINAIRGKHLKRKTKSDVEIFWISDTVMTFIPRGLTDIFPNLICFDIENCGLKEICREDLVGFENLEDLRVDFNGLTTLPDDLFVNTPKLKNISFTGNKIETMSSSLFKPIKNNKFKCINFRGNKKLNAIYEPGSVKSVSSIAELMCIIDAQCFKPRPVETSQVIHENFIKSLENVFETGQFSDFVIIVNEQKEFKVHKIILAAQSEVFAEIFQNDPTSNEMKIKDLSPEAVDEFMRYLYTGKLPINSKNSMEIFALASKLKVPELITAMQKQILSSLDGKNAWKIFSLAHKYKSDELKQSAFKEIQKLFPDKYLPEEMANHYLKLQEIMKLKMKMDDILAEVSK